MDGGNSCVPIRQTQVLEEQQKIGAFMTELSEEVSKLEQRLQVCLRQEPKGENAGNERKNAPKVELANWLSIHADDIQKQFYRIRNIIERCEL